MTAFRGFLLHSTLLLWAAWALAQAPLSRISTGGVCSSEVVTLRTDDGVRLQGIVFRASKPRASALLLVHGYAGNFYEAYFPELAAAAAHAGYDTLALNMRDHDAGAKMQLALPTCVGSAISAWLCSDKAWVQTASFTTRPPAATRTLQLQCW